MVQVTSILGTEPVTLNEAKDHCYETGNDNDNLLLSLISAAREYAEGKTWKQIIEATLVLKLDEFPSSLEIVLPRPPAISVTSVEYVDEDGATQTWSDSNYDVDTFSEYARIRPVDTVGDWPSTKDQMNAVIVTYKAGYDNSDPQHYIPTKIKQAILMLVKYWYDNRDAVVISQGRTVDAMEPPLATDTLLGMESARAFV